MNFDQAIEKLNREYQSKPKGPPSLINSERIRLRSEAQQSRVRRPSIASTSRSLQIIQSSRVSFSRVIPNQSPPPKPAPRRSITPRAPQKPQPPKTHINRTALQRRQQKIKESKQIHYTSLPTPSPSPSPKPTSDGFIQGRSKPVLPSRLKIKDE